MEFIRGFPGVAARFGIEGIIYDGTPRPGGAAELDEARTAWDRLNRLALEKLCFYVTDCDACVGNLCLCHVHIVRLCVL